MAPTTLPMPAADASRLPIATARAALAHGAVLALDLGTATGWALRARDGAITSGTVSFRPAATTAAACATCASAPGSTNRHGRRRPRRDLLRRSPRTSQHRRGACLWRLARPCSPPGASSTSIPYQGVPVGTIKRYVTGKGNADKAAVIAAVRPAASIRPTTTRPMRSPSCCGRPRPREAAHEPPRCAAAAALLLDRGTAARPPPGDGRHARRAWHQQGVAALPVDDITDPWLRQAITNEANRRWGRRTEETTMAGKRKAKRGEAKQRTWRSRRSGGCSTAASRADPRGADPETGTPVQHRRAVDTLGMMLATAPSRRRCTRRGDVPRAVPRAALDGMRHHAADPDPGRSADQLTERQSVARQQVAAAMDALGGHESPAGACAWHVVGLETRSANGRCGRAGADARWPGAGAGHAGRRAGCWPCTSGSCRGRGRHPPQHRSCLYGWRRTIGGRE